MSDASLGQIRNPANAGAGPSGDYKEQPILPRIGDGPAVLLGMAAIAVFFGVFGTWAVMAPLESAAIAPGSVRIDSNRKTVQHLEGGIIGEIRVRDGDQVRAGQNIIVLDDTQAKANLDLLMGRYLAARGLEARLIAERDRKDQIKFPPEFVTENAKEVVVETIQGQTSIFNTRRQALTGNRLVLKQQISALGNEIRGLKSKVRAETSQLDLVAEEIKDVTGLFNKGLAKKPRLLSLQRAQADLQGRKGENQAQIARAQERIAEAKLRIQELVTNMQSEVAADLRTVQEKLFDLRERIAAARDVLQRTRIKAPLDGVVVSLRVHTAGGVIKSGEPLLDIVPSKDPLVVEAQLDPNDIDIVHPGLPAEVRLTSFNMRNTEPVKGKIRSVSADRLTDERSGAAYYLVRVELTEDPTEVLGGASLYPGMPAEVMIVTGAQTALGYFLKPLTASFNRAFRDQ